MKDITARYLALQILNDYTPKKTNVSHLLNSYLSEFKSLSDKGFVREVVWGVIRHLNTIDWIIKKYTDKNKKIESQIRNILRIGIFQIMFLEKIPDHAAVNETVGLVHKIKKKKASAFANAILRNLIRDKDEIEWPKEKLEFYAIKYSYPRWIVERWIKRYGESDALKLFSENDTNHPVTIRTNTLKISREGLKEELLKEGVKSSNCDFSSDGLVLDKNPEIEKLRCYKEGYFIIQDEASQLISCILDPKKGDIILDICSGAGVKASHLSQLTESKAKVICIDNSKKQVEKAKRNLKLLGCGNVELIKDDIRNIDDILADKVLLDVPCSGFGAISRKPDIKWNRSLEDVLHRYPIIQKELLTSAFKLLKIGGILVYATCTSEPEENEDLVSNFLNSRKDCKLEKIESEFLIDFLSRDKKYFKTYNNKEMSGFFAVKLKKTSDNTGVRY